MDLQPSQEFDLPENLSKNWDAGFAVHQLIINEVSELLEKHPKDIAQIEELIGAILDLIEESNYGRDEFFTMVNHLKTINKKLAGKYLKEYEMIYSSKISF